jgi:hypothetical protein
LIRHARVRREQLDIELGQQAEICSKRSQGTRSNRMRRT